MIRTAFLVVPAILSVLTPAVDAAEPESQAERQWGASKAGVQLSLAIPGKVRVGGKLSVDLAVRNVGSAAVKLPSGKDVFGWMLLIYDRDNAFITEKVFPAAELTAWPGELAGGKTVQFASLELASSAVYAYAKRQQVYTVYLKPEGGAKLPASDGTLGKKLAAGKAKAVLMLYIPRPGESPLLLTSNSVLLDVAGSKWSELSPEARKALATKLLAKFDRDAWSAMAAHGEAVALGPPISPYLVEAVKDRKRPSHARLWLATALADIRCEESVAGLIELLDGPAGGVQSVVGYHGPKQNSEKLDAAIIAKAAAGKNAGMLSYTLLGFMVFREQAPAKLLEVSFESTDPRVRATVAAAMKNHASDLNLSRLAALLADENEQVRSAAATALGAMNRAGEPVLAALVRSLSAPGDHARQSIAKALGQLTGRNAPYSPAASPAEKEKVVQGWKDWWVKRTTKTGGP